MPRHVFVDSFSRAVPTHIPDDLRAGVTLLTAFAESGLIRDVDRRLPTSRRDGFGAGDLFALAVVFLLAGRRWGIRPFIATFKDALEHLVAPVAGLRELPAQASVSRILSEVSESSVRDFVDGLLLDDPGVDALLSSPHVLHRDARGEGWHVVDFDPTIEAFRQRGLPDAPDLPPPKRRAVGSPGYTGHKRGEIRYRHLPCLHAGAGLWMAYRGTARAGSILPLFDEMIRQVVARLATLPTKRLIIRGDGEFGSVGAMHTVLNAGAEVLTRLARYTLLDREDVTRGDAGRIWRPVPSSLSGPSREAAELGVFELFPAEGAAGPGGPITLRVIVTRFARESPPEHGVLRDGYQYELFATSLTAGSWPAEELAALYFGRGTIENHFAQEDREFGIDRTFSFSPAGQEWMSGVALFLWNTLVCRAVASRPLPIAVAKQERRPVVEEAAGARSPVAETSAGQGPASDEQPVIEEPTDELPAAAQPPADVPPLELGPEAKPEGEQIPAVAVAAVAGDRESVERAIWALTRELFGDIEQMPGWRFDDEHRAIRCPTERRHFAQHAHAVQSGRPTGRVVARGEFKACNGCLLRDSCSKNTGPYRILTRAAPADRAAGLTDLLDQARLHRRRDGRSIPRKAGTQGAAVVDPSQGPALAAIAAAPNVVPSPTVGPFVPQAPAFVACAARAYIRRLIEGTSFEVTPGTVPKSKREHPFLAQDQPARRHQRKSWTQRREARSLDCSVRIVVTGTTARLVAAIMSSLEIQVDSS